MGNITFEYRVRVRYIGVTYVTDEYSMPPEPIEIRRRALEEVDSGRLAVDRRDKAIKYWTLSTQFLPKYLWRYWESTLKARGLTWPKFLRALSACEYDVVRWVEGELSWTELVRIIVRVLDKAERGAYPLWPP